MLTDHFISVETSEKLSEFIRDIKYNNYNFLYNTQMNLCGIKRFNFKMQDVVNIEHYPELKKYNMQNKKVFLLNYSFIGDSARSNLNRSDFIFEEIDSKMISENRRIFDKNFITFINGRVSLYIKLLCLEEHTYVIFDLDKPILPFEGNKIIEGCDFTDLYKMNADISLLVVPNGHRISGPTNVKDLKNFGGSIPFEYPAFNHNEIYEGYKSERYMTFVSSDNSRGMVLQDVTNDNGQFIFSLNRIRQSYGRFLIDSLAIPNLIQEIKLPAGTKTFKIEDLSMPVPVENIIPFYRDRRGYRLFDHSLNITPCYPNFYFISGNNIDKEISLFVIYKKSGSGSYTNYMKKFYEYTDIDAVKKYNMNLMPGFIYNFKESLFDFSIDDYNKQECTQTEYKINKVSEIISTNIEYSERLFKIMADDLEFYWIGLDSSVKDISGNYRLNDNDEGGITTFSKPMYVFLVPNSNNAHIQMDQCYLIDGLLRQPEHILYSDDYAYVYFDASLITPGKTVFEYFMNLVDVFETTQYIKSYRQFYEINLSKEYYIHPKMFNISFLDENDNLLSSNQIGVQLINAEGEYVSLDSADGIVESASRFRFRVKDMSLVHKNIKIIVDNTTKYFQRDRYETVLDGTISQEISQYNTDYNKKGMLLFINGRKTPHSSNIMRKSEGYYDLKSFVNTLVKRHPGDIMNVVRLPRMYRQIYFNEYIPENGVIDLTSILNKPLNFAYHEFFLNGRKLQEKQVEFLSCTIIRVKNVPTRWNLEILEKEFINDSEIPKGIFKDSITNQVYARIKDNIGEMLIIETEDNAFEYLTELDLEHADFLNKYVIPFREVGIIDCLVDRDVSDVKLNFPNMVEENTVIIGGNRSYGHGHIEMV